jgi:hypothetical protein
VLLSHLPQILAKRRCLMFEGRATLPAYAAGFALECFAPDSPLEEAVKSELVSAGESLLIWENTGYLFQFGLIRAIQPAY